MSDWKYRTSALKISLYSMLNTADFVKHNYLFISSLYHNQSFLTFWPIHSVIWKLALLLCMWDKQLQAPTASKTLSKFQNDKLLDMQELTASRLTTKDWSFINNIPHSHMTQPPWGTEVATSLLKLKLVSANVGKSRSQQLNSQASTLQVLLLVFRFGFQQR